MNIHRENSFLICDFDTPPSIGIESARLRECLDHYHKAGFGGVFGNPSLYFRETNLDFLEKCPSARRVWFWECSFDSIDGLYSLQNLEHCGVMEKRPGIDYSRFRKLHTVVARWHKKDLGFRHSTIRSLYLWHYNPGSKTFQGLELPKDIERLELTWLNPSNLEGLPVMEKLTELQIHMGRNLSDLSTLTTIAPNLKTLIITSCRRLQESEALSHHPNLELALIDGREIKTGIPQDAETDVPFLIKAAPQPFP